MKTSPIKLSGAVIFSAIFVACGCANRVAGVDAATNDSGSVLPAAKATMPINATAIADTPTPAPIRLDCAEAGLHGAIVRRVRAGFTGGGYVDALGGPDDRFSLDFDVPISGLFDVAVRYASPDGQKGFDLDFDGVFASGLLAGTGDAFAWQTAAVVHLDAGKHTLTVRRGWGRVAWDAIELRPRVAGAVVPPPSETPIDPRATPPARRLLAALVRATVAGETWSGVYADDDADYVRSITGRRPRVMGGDLMDCSPSRLDRLERPDAGSIEVERLLKHARAGHPVTLSWHWNAPADLLDRVFVRDDGGIEDARWFRGFNAAATTFDLGKALDDSGSVEATLLLRDIDAIAARLRVFQDAGVAVLWRPLHEADGRWFWWGAHGPQRFKTLWRLMFDRLTNRHGLHNLLWVYTAGAEAGWYPGDDVVDVVGIDAYTHPADALGGQWVQAEAAAGGRKVVALTEFGGTPDLELARRNGVRWAYFVSWSGVEGPRKTSPADLRTRYELPYVGCGPLDTPESR